MLLVMRNRSLSVAASGEAEATHLERSRCQSGVNVGTRNGDLENEGGKDEGDNRVRTATPKECPPS